MIEGCARGPVLPPAAVQQRGEVLNGAEEGPSGSAHEQSMLRLRAPLAGGAFGPVQAGSSTRTWRCTSPYCPESLSFSAAAIRSANPGWIGMRLLRGQAGAPRFEAHHGPYEAR